MKLVRAECSCGYFSNKVRCGSHFFQWWFPIYHGVESRLSESYFQMPVDEQRRLLTNCSESEIKRHTSAFERQIIEGLRSAAGSELKSSKWTLIDECDLNDAKLVCRKCNGATLLLRQVTVWAVCRTDCDRRYLWKDSEEIGCPICEHRPHSFEMELDQPRNALHPTICYCGCSSHTVCNDNGQIDCFCPKCGELFNDNYFSPSH